MLIFKWNRTLVLCTTLLLVGCDFNLDTDVKGVIASSNIVLPLGYGDLSIQDFLGDADSANIRVYESGEDEGVVYLYYEQTLKTQGVGDLLVLENKSISKGLNINPSGIPIPVPPNTQNQALASGTLSFDLDFDPEKFEEILFTQGQLLVTTTTTPASSLQFEAIVTLPTFQKNGVPLQQTIQTSSTAQPISVAGYLATLNENFFDVQVAVVIKPHNSTVNIPPNTQFNINLQFSNLNFDYVIGFFGDQTANPSAETLNVGAFENSFDEGNVSLADPRISFEVINEYGIPISVIFNDLEARNSTGTLPITLDPSSPINANFPPVRGDSAFTNVSVTNAGALLDFEPTSFFYSVSARINAGLTTGTNFTENDSELKVRMKVEVPFIGSASDFVVSDTIDIDISEVEGSEIERAAIKIKAINNIPINATLQLYLLDENDFVLDSLLAPNTTVVNGAETDASGNSIAAGVFDDEIEISKEKINKLFKSKKILIASKLETADNPKDVKFKSTDKLSITLGLNVSLNLNVDL
jgi:hypothetical protein